MPAPRRAPPPPSRASHRPYSPEVSSTPVSRVYNPKTTLPARVRRVNPSVNALESLARLAPLRPPSPRARRPPSRADRPHSRRPRASPPRAFFSLFRARVAPSYRPPTAPRARARWEYSTSPAIRRRRARGRRRVARVVRVVRVAHLLSHVRRHRRRRRGEELTELHRPTRVARCRARRRGDATRRRASRGDGEFPFDGLVSCFIRGCGAFRVLCLFRKKRNLFVSRGRARAGVSFCRRVESASSLSAAGTRTGVGCGGIV